MELTAHKESFNIVAKEETKVVYDLLLVMETEGWTEETKLNPINLI